MVSMSFNIKPKYDKKIKNLIWLNYFGAVFLMNTLGIMSEWGTLVLRGQ